ncbi:MAG: glycosyltransferase [Vicinamibacterales bacterium]|nr:glycosyltransferase [Vicinamibacterales bacterium]
MNPHISVVIATRDRGASVARLVRQLDAQTLRHEAFEMVVVDDGSADAVAPHLAGLRTGASVHVSRIEWSGQAAARHHGALIARGDVLVFLDDDMQVGTGYLEAQRAHHAAVPHAVVLGRISPDPGLGRMPLFERYHARQLERWRRSMLGGTEAPRGQHLCTGNVSMRREDYLAVGGFNPELRRSEDRELGIRLEKHGCAIVYGDDVESVHSSDHASLRVWLRRAYLYGRFDRRIAALHLDVPSAHPWRFWALIHPWSRPIVAVSLVWPGGGRVLALAAFVLARAADAVRVERVALTLTAFAYALTYFAGLRDECGSFAAFRADARQAAPPQPGAFARFRAAVRADHDNIRRYRRKYAGESISRHRLVLDLVTKVGFQMMAWYRVMRLLDEWHVPVMPMVVSRLIRHLYGADIHWAARLAPGVSIVHGIGLILSPRARVEAGCILFQYVTLGENVDPLSGEIGAPHVGPDVHVGPGATLLGPITVGAATKIGAGVVLMRSVPASSLVTLPEPLVSARRAPRHRAVGPLARVAS